MAETHTGEAYYDAGTINEQLDDYEVYEQNGRLFLNKEGADPQEYVSFGGLTQYLQNPRDSTNIPDAEELAEGETALYTRYVDGGTEDGITLFAAHHEVGGDGSVTETEVAVLVAPET